MQKILATGAIGLVGSRFLELYKDKYQVDNIDILSGVDITDLSSVEQFIQSHPSDTLIHLAAFTDTDRANAESGNKAGLCYMVNVVGTQNLAKVCKSHGIHLIHISTDFVFDGNQTTPYLEESPLSPLGWYGETKALAEKVFTNSGVSSTILRLAYPYRANFDKKRDLIKKIRAGLESSSLPPQFSDNTITPTFVDDIASSFDKVIETKPRGIYHIVGSTSLSSFTLAQKVAVAYGFDPSLVKEGSLTEYLKTTSRPFARHVSMSNAKATQELKLKFFDIDAGLATIKKQQGL